MKNKILILYLLIVIIVGVLIFLLINKESNNYSFNEITNYQTVSLPLDSPEEAIQYSLSIPEVRDILLNKDTADYRKYGEEWSARAFIHSPIGEIGSDKFQEEGYIVNWYKGKKCHSYELLLSVTLNGVLLTNLTSSEGRPVLLSTCV